MHECIYAKLCLCDCINLPILTVFRVASWVYLSAKHGHVFSVCTHWCVWSSTGHSRTCPSRQSCRTALCWTPPCMTSCAVKAWTLLSEIPCTHRCGGWSTSQEEPIITWRTRRRVFARCGRTSHLWIRCRKMLIYRNGYMGHNRQWH